MYNCKKCNQPMKIDYLKFIENSYCDKCAVSIKYTNKLIKFGVLRPLNCKRNNRA